VGRPGYHLTVPATPRDDRRDERTLRITGVTSWPAESRRVNEDHAVVSENVAVVVDGAGLPASMRSGCGHPVAWYAEQVARCLHRHLRDERLSMRMALRSAIADVSGLHADGCDLSAGSPSATVAAWRVRNSDLEYLVLCDSSVVISTADGRYRHVTDDRLELLMGRAIDSFIATRSDAASLPSETELREVRRSTVDARRNTVGGFWCCHHDPAAADEAVTGSVPLSSLVGIALATDGAMRGVQLLGIQTLADMVDLAVAGRHAECLGQIRDAEREQRARLSALAVKPHDDATIISARRLSDAPR
jgi:hypothetical protein